MSSLDIAALKASVLAAFKKGNKTMKQRLEDIIDSTFNRTDDAGGGGSLTLGETNVTAYRGDRGKEAYDHSQSSHAPADAVALSNSYTDTEIAALDAAILILLAAKANALGADDNYVTDAMLVILGNTSGSNSGDQDISGLVVKANNLSDLTNAGTALTNLGGNAVGKNIFLLANPGAVVFIRVNADNSITLRSAAQLLSDIGAQAAGTYLVAGNNLSDLANAATARGNLGGTTVGGNLFLLANPGAITFIRVNADNTVTTRSAANFRSDIGATTLGAALLLMVDVAAIRFIRVNADNTVSTRTAAEMLADIGAQASGTYLVAGSNLSDVSNAVTARTNLGATTLGSALFLLTNVAAIRFLRVNADNTVSTRTAAEMLADIGAQASGTYLVAGNNLSDLANAATARGNLGATTVGAALFLLANPGAITFLRINADNTVTSRSAANFITDIGGTTIGAAILTLANPGAITFLRMNADNSATARSAANFLIDLGATTVGAALLALANPGVVTFIRINADNTITARTAAQLLSDIGAQAAGTYLVAGNNLSDVSNAGTARTNLGGTTVGQNIFLLANPGAIRFIRINADNSITSRTAAELLADISAQAAGAYLTAANIVQVITNGNIATSPSEDAVFDALADKAQVNSAEFSQVVVSGTAYYITGTAINVKTTTLQVGSSFTWRLWLSKTAAGTGTFQIRIYRGTNGTTGDTADVTQTIGPVQTGIVDSMWVDVTIYVTTIGAAGAYFWTISPMNKAASAAGFGIVTGTTGLFSGSVAAVALNTANLKFGIAFISTTGTPTVRVPSIQKFS